jgi:hypothetical protein
MSLYTKLKKLLLGPKPLTADHRPPPAAHFALRVDELPSFDLHVAEVMRFDPQVRIGLGARNGMLMQASVEVVGDRAEENKFVRDQWLRIWNSAAGALLKAKLYGFVPCEVMYRRQRGGAHDGAIVIDRLEPRHPRDARPLLHHGRIAGFALRLASGRSVKVLAPKGLVVTFDAEFGNPYGCALLERAYPAWHEKWMEGGAKRLLRQRMMKDAYVGDVLFYPPEAEYELPNGQTMPWRDLAQDLVEARNSGGTLTLPSLYDAEGHRLIDYQPPQSTGGMSQIFQWKRDIDNDIWKALEVPPEVIEAFARGSGYAGRTVPLLICLAAVQQELAEIMACVDRDVLRPLAHLNFGRPPEYEIRARSLLQAFSEKLPS